ncbi:MAG: glycosyl hydrolase [Bacteroidia bacterium]|nr:glycosyl hydrolase [Bacteroidia bacterium]
MGLSAQHKATSITDSIGSIRKAFLNPPESARPWVYWFWVNSNVSRKGITADLEAMKRVGIGGVLIMDINLNTMDRIPTGSIKFMDGQWKEMFRFAVQEAHRLGLEVNMTNDAGWTGSGGPWITPENAMQTVVSSETPVTGSRLVDTMLPQPPAKGDYYRDIAVMAVRNPDLKVVHMMDAAPSLSISTDEGVSSPAFPTAQNPLKLSFNNTEKLPSLSIRFDSSFTACVLDLTATGLVMDGWFEAVLQVSNDGKEFKSVKTFSLKNGKNSVVFNLVAASRFRIQLLKAHTKQKEVTLSDLEIHPRYHIEYFPLKALFSKSGIFGQSAALSDSAPANVILSQGNVINLTENMDVRGHLKWNAPAGKWIILRIGHTFTGVNNGPAPLEGTGPECDKLSKEGIRKNFDGMMKKLVELVGPDAGKTLVTAHIDSWEVGPQNWTKNMPEEFKKRRGYDIVPFLPVFTGRVIGDLQITERFMWDLRKTISELMVENYVAEMQKLCHEHGLRFSFESYNTIGNDLDAANWTDEPMSEFWTRNDGDWYFDKVKGMSSAAHLNNRPIAGAESFTSAEEERWLLHPANIKAIGDRFLCDGVNRFVFHRFAMQPWLNRKPGMSMGPYGLHYERTQTWWEYSLPWHSYLTRCQYLLRQGTFVSDVLNLQPEETIYRYKILPITGYDYDACSPDAFQRVKVSDGKLIDGSGNSHRLLVLTHTGTMTESTLRHIRDLVVQGASVLGDPPLATPGLTDYPKADVKLTAMVEELWGTRVEHIKERKVGKGRVFQNISPEEALSRIGLVSDFVSDKKLRYIHRKINDSDVYFVANGADSTIVANCTFRVTGKRPSLWDPETGKTKALRTYATTGEGTIRIPVLLGPAGSVFVVFSPKTDSDPKRVVKITCNGETLLQDGIASRDIKNENFKAGIFDVLSGKISFPGSYIFTKADGEKLTVNSSSELKPMVVSGPWKLKFPAGSGVSADVTLNQLESWTRLPDKEINYFSGTGSYSKTLVIPTNSIKKGNQLYLDLGKVQVMANVFVNGKNAGIIWKPPYRTDITSLVHEGENSLKIEVVNLWVNRQIGDELLPEDSERNPNGTLKQNTWPDWLSEEKPSPTGRHSFTTWRLWKKDDVLQESGLLGPVTLRQVKSVE